MKELILSQLGHTWILDLDGTLVVHNGYKTEEGERFLDGALGFLRSIPAEDMIIFVTSRKTEQKQLTEDFLAQHNVRYDHIIYNAPYGERIMINDSKPSGLQTAVAVNLKRDEFEEILIKTDEKL